MINRRSLLSWMIGAVAATVVAMLAAPLPVAAASLDEAKSAGYVGERPDGYLGLVSRDAPSDVQRLVDQINSQRRQKYAEIAARTGTDVRQVAILAGQKLVSTTAPGNYFMNAGGQWVRR